MSLFKHLRNRKKKPMLDTETASILLNRVGFSVILTPDPEDGQVYVGIKTDNIDYDRLFRAIKIDYPVLMDVVESIPHYKWLLAIFQKYKPQIIKIDDNIAFMMPEHSNMAKHPHIDARLNAIIGIISEAIIGYLGILQLSKDFYKEQEKKYSGRK